MEFSKHWKRWANEDAYMSLLKNPVGSEDHIQGDEDALCTLVEYGDYECPHCRAAHPVIKRVERHFGKRLCFVFRNFPLTQIHANAQSAAETAEFAASEGKFWEMHDLLFENQDQLGDDLYAELATQLGLDAAKLQESLENGAYTGRVQSDFTGGVRSGVNGTPTFFVNGQRHNGPADFDHLVEAIEAAIAR
jgi:protein-disulfide isomerase